MNDLRAIYYLMSFFLSTPSFQLPLRIRQSTFCFFRTERVDENFSIECENDIILSGFYSKQVPLTVRLTNDTIFSFIIQRHHKDEDVWHLVQGVFDNCCCESRCLFRMEKEEHDEMSRVDDCTNKCCRHRAASPHSQKEQRLLPLLHSWTYSDSFFFSRTLEGNKTNFLNIKPIERWDTFTYVLTTLWCYEQQERSYHSLNIAIRILKFKEVMMMIWLFFFTRGGTTTSTTRTQ